MSCSFFCTMVVVLTMFFHLSFLVAPGNHVFAGSSDPVHEKIIPQRAESSMAHFPPMPYSVESAQKVISACNLDAPAGFEEPSGKDKAAAFRRCFQKAGYDFEKSVVRFFADYTIAPESFLDEYQMVYGLILGQSAKSVVTWAKDNAIDLREVFAPAVASALECAAQYGSALQLQWEADMAKLADEEALRDIKNAFTSAIAASMDDNDVVVTRELLMKNGYRPHEGVTLAIIDGSLKSLKITTAHKSGRKIYEINAMGDITNRNKD